QGDDRAKENRPDRGGYFWSEGRPGPAAGLAMGAAPRAQCDARRSRLPGSRVRPASAEPAGPSHDPLSIRTPADARASRNSRVPWKFPLVWLLGRVLGAQARVPAPGAAE